MRKYYSPLIGAALAAASLFQFSLPTFAAGTEAGEVLRNTATGSYQDDAGNPYTIESNTVDVTVAKVAGITNQPLAINDETSDANNTSVLTNDTVSFEFVITNVGNDASNIFIPSADNITTRGLRTAAGDITVEVSEINPGATPTFAARSTLTNGIVENVPINGQIIVKVSGTVSATAAGAPIEVLLGNTASNDEPNNPLPETQNQPDTIGTESGGEADDVRTVTADNANTQVNGAPAGGQKEASALQQIFLGSNPLAMTRIEKTRGEVQDGATAALTDNIIPYSLDLEVLNTTPNPLFVPGNLIGRDYTAPNTGTFNGSITNQTNLILVSDAIPANTTLVTGSANTPANWTPVYTDDDPATVLPDEATWETDPTQLTNPVTRIGWVYDARATPDGSGPIAPGTALPGFTFNVETTGLTADGGTIANIAQVFGSTVGSDNPVFDESGDQDPSNFNGATPGPDETDPQSTGVANPAVQGVDSENNNNANGTDPASPGGEDNVITIGAPGDLLNGPVGQPTATGDVFGVANPDNNHDFQNAGVDNFPDGAKHDAGTTFDPNVVTFTNTLSNPGTTDLTNVLLQPINPEFDANFTGNATDTDLPFGTTVTLTLGGQTATYTYNEVPGANQGDPSTGEFRLSDGAPIQIPTLTANTPLDYTVAVDLPPDTGLSTDTDINGGFPVPVIAFIDENSDGTPNIDPDPALSENYNISVNQVYTGFVKVTKQVKITGPDPDGNIITRRDFGVADTNAASDDPRPGDTLEYRVIYRNISEPQVGTGNNGILIGQSVTIDEDGTLAAVTGDTSGNNWALDNNNDSDIDTFNVQGSAADTNGGTITFFTGASTTTTPLGAGMIPSGTVDPGDTVTGYRSTVGRLAPEGTEAPAALNSYDPGNGDSAFTFERIVDDFDGLAEEGLERTN